MLPEDPALRRRLLLATALLILLPFCFIYAFVAAFNHIFLPTLNLLGYGPFLGGVYVEPWLAVVVVSGGLTAQAVFGPSTVLSSLGARPASNAEYPELHGAVTRLSQQAGIESPTIAITTNGAPNAAAVRGPRGASIVVTTGLLEALDDREREAVLAHEIAHLQNRDATVMTVAWLLPTITYYLSMAAAHGLYGVSRMLGSAGSSGRDGKGVVKLLVVLTVTAVVTIAVSALFWAASVLLYRILSQYREYAADRGAVALTGDPAALATALRRMDELMPKVSDTDLRRLDGGTEALYVAPLDSRAFTDAELVSTDLFPATHPPTDERIERLGRLAGELS